MDAAATFRSAVNDLQAGMDQQREARAEIVFDDQPPPRKLAPYAAAIGATVHEPSAVQDATPRSAGAALCCSTTRQARTAGAARSA